MVSGVQEERKIELLDNLSIAVEKVKLFIIENEAIFSVSDLPHLQ